MIFRQPNPSAYPSRFTVYNLWIDSKETQIQVISSAIFLVFIIFFIFQLIVTHDANKELPIEDGLSYMKRLSKTVDLDIANFAIYRHGYFKK